MIGATHPRPSAFRGGSPRLLSTLSNTRLWQCGLLSREEQDALEEATSPAKSVGPDVDLVREGERAEALFIVTAGWACRYAVTRDGRRQLSALLVPGDVANLDSLMFDRLDYGVRTISQATIVAVPRDRAIALAAQHAGIARTFAWLGMVENAILRRWSLAISRRSAIERLAHLLCELSVRLGAESEGESSFAFPLTQEQVADALGLTAVHVNRTVKHLRTDGLVASARARMTIRNVAGLRLLGGFDPRYLRIAARDCARPTLS